MLKFDKHTRSDRNDSITGSMNVRTSDKGRPPSSKERKNISKFAYQ